MQNGFCWIGYERFDYFVAAVGQPFVCQEFTALGAPAFARILVARSSLRVDTFFSFIELAPPVFVLLSDVVSTAGGHSFEELFLGDCMWDMADIW